LPQAWSDWAIWQYTSSGHVDGVAGNVDLNVAKPSIFEEDDMDEATVKAIVDKAIADRSAKLASFAMTAGRFVAWKEAVGTPEEGPRFDAFYNLDIKWRVEDAIP
jgi:hypothetical protein